MSTIFNIQKDLLIRREDVQLVGKVGEGNYGEVWKANWRKVTVAVKKLLVQNATPEAIQMLEREITTAARLRHPHVVQLYGACVYSPTEIWIVMEYADGGSLYSKLSDKKTAIPWDVRLRWAREATTAVAFLHSARTLHRDIKSPNFLLVKGEIKITDFGMSTAIIATYSSKQQQDKAKENVGSVRWMAPETTAGNPAFSEKSDIFSLGMVFWEIATREIPFAKVTQDAQVVVLIKYEKERPAIPPETPKALAEIITKCWDDSPKKRPTAEEILFMIETEDVSPDGFQKALQLSPTPQQPPLKRYFDINRGELLAEVPKDRIKVLTTPPPFPQKGASPPFPLPSTVEIVTLLPPKDVRRSKHMLVSERYDERLFSRVAEYFYRFYVPQNSETKVTMDKVEIIFNSALEEQFRKADALLESQCKGVAEFSDPSQSEAQNKYLSHLQSSKNLVPNFSSNPISAWHGSGLNSLESICWYGLLNLSKNDPGYYGKGMYFTQEPKYGEFYAEIMKEKAHGKFSLLLCWVLIGRPYAITKVHIGSQLAKGYHSHFSLVKQKEATKDMCKEVGDFKSIDGLWSYFPISGDEQVEGDEIVIFDGAQVLPRFVVHYSVSGPTTQPASTPNQKIANRNSMNHASPNQNFLKPMPDLPTFKLPTKKVARSFTTSAIPSSTEPNFSTTLPLPLKPQLSPNTPLNPFLSANAILQSPDDPETQLTDPSGYPAGEDVKVWITVNTIDQFNNINFIYNFVQEFCTETSCTQMNAGPKVSYFWAQDKSEKPISLPAPMYVKKLRAWILEKLEDPKIFPGAVTSVAGFGPHFSSTVKKIWSRMFRVYAHVYHSHWDKLTSAAIEEFMFNLKYLVQFSKEFNLLKEQELDPVKELLEKWK